ncbi:MAG: sigma-70 family RNA polymerase sigma factor [Planctomycetes bacterium]|nr:sigma-70 family RNA polymerase sigma factor [Planctomycetota bacterium]
MDRDEILREAFAAHDSLRVYAYSLVRDYSSAEDAVQNAYVTVTKRYETFEIGRSVEAWVRGIVRFEVLKIIEKQRRVIPTEDTILFDSVADLFESEDRPDLAVLRAEKYDTLKVCYSKLPERSKEMIAGRYFKNLKNSVLSEKLKMSHEALRKGIYRVRGILKECMNRELGSVS